MHVLRRRDSEWWWPRERARGGGEGKGLLRAEKFRSSATTSPKSTGKTLSLHFLLIPRAGSHSRVLGNKGGRSIQSCASNLAFLAGETRDDGGRKELPCCCYHSHYLFPYSPQCSTYRRTQLHKPQAFLLTSLLFPFFPQEGQDQPSFFITRSALSYFLEGTAAIPFTGEWEPDSLCTVG